MTAQEGIVRNSDQPPDRMRGRRIRIVVENTFGPLLTAAFPEAAITPTGARTVLTVGVHDDEALYGFLDRLRDLGIRIVSLRELGPQERFAD